MWDLSSMERLAHSRGQHDSRRPSSGSPPARKFAGRSCRTTGGSYTSGAGRRRYVRPAGPEPQPPGNILGWSATASAVGARTREERSVPPQSREAREWPNWSARSASRRWSSIFSREPCGTSRRQPRRATGVAPERLEVTALDQLWVPDITYLRLLEQFAFLAIVLDAFSRRVIGWALELHLRASLALAALKRALTARRPPPGTRSTTPIGACNTPAPSTRRSWPTTRSSRA